MPFSTGFKAVWIRVYDAVKIFFVFTVESDSEHLEPIKYVIGILHYKNVHNDLTLSYFILLWTASGYKPKMMFICGRVNGSMPPG